MRDLAFLLCFAGLVPFALRSVFVGVLLWAWVSLLGPNFFLYGIATEVPYNKVVAALTFVALLVGREEKRLRLDRTSVLVLLFLLVAALSQFTAPVDATLGWEILDKLWKIALLNLLVVSFATTRVRLQSLVLIICLGVGFNGAGEAFKSMLSGGFHVIEGIPNWGDNNHVALMVLLALPLLLYVRATSASPLVRLGALVGAVLFVICVVATRSRGGFVGLSVLGIAAVATGRHKIRGALLLLVLGAALFALAPASWTQRMDTIGEAESDDSFMNRVIAWKISTLIALNYPLGGGLHGVQSNQLWNSVADQFDRLSFVPTEPPGQLARAAHSIYFEVLGDTGFPGLLIFLGLILSSFRAGARARALARNRPELAWAGLLARQLQLSLLVYTISGAALSAAYHDLTFLLFGLLSAVRNLVAAEASRNLARAEAPAWRARPASLAADRAIGRLSPQRPHRT